ncbi:MAG: hypothetical protein ACM3X7_06290 [Solirubrobacterales bacterium]
MKAYFDALSRYLMVVGILFLFDKYLRFLGLVIISYAIWRAYSRNQYKRHLELIAFENFIHNLKDRYNKLILNLKNKKKYKVFVCPGCSQKLRVPRNRGRVTITCSRCNRVFKGKS